MEGFSCASTASTTFPCSELLEDWLLLMPVDPVPNDEPKPEDPRPDEAPRLERDPKFEVDPNPDPSKPDVAWNLLPFEEEVDCEDHFDCEFSPLEDPECWTDTVGPLLTVPVKLVTGVDSPLMAASMAASIDGFKDLITESTRLSALFARELVTPRDP